MPFDRIVTEVMWPTLQVKEGYSLTRVVTKKSQTMQGYEQASRDDDKILLRDFSGAGMHRISREDIEKVEMPTVDLSDIKSDYSVDVEEDEDYDDYEPMGPTPSEMEDEELMDYVGQKEEDLVDDMQQHIAPDFLHKENFEEMFEKYREEVLEPAAEEISQEMAMDQMSDEMEMDAEESIEDTSGKALEAAMEELKKLAGLNEEDKKEFDEAGCRNMLLKPAVGGKQLGFEVGASGSCYFE